MITKRLDVIIVLKVLVRIVSLLSQPWRFFKRITFNISAPQKILINISSPVMGLGNFIMTLPLIKILKEKSPKSEVYLLVSKASNRQIIDLFQRDVKIIFCSEHEYFRKKDFLKFIYKEIRSRKFSLLINGNSESWDTVQLLSLISGIPFGIGYQNAVDKMKNLLNTYTLPNDLPGLTFIYDNNFRKLFELGSEFNKQYFINDRKRWINNTKHILGIHPGCNPYFKIKRWPIENNIKVALYFISKYQGEIRIFGTDEEKEEIDKLAQSLDSRNISIYQNCSLQDVMKGIQGCELFLSNDCGLMHLSSMLGVSNIAIFGPTSSKHLRYLYKNNWFLETSLDCKPCYMTEHYRQCGYEMNPPCLKAITVNEVLKTIDEIIEN